MAMMAASNMMGIATIHDSWFLEMMSNPLRTGALQIFDTWDEPFPIKAAVSTFQ